MAAPPDRRVEDVKHFARWTVLSVTTLSSFMAAIDANIVVLALPKISQDFNSGISLLGWVITGYILATAMLLLQAGKIGDWYGKKKVYLFGFALFGIASALCGLSQSTSEIISFRIVQGVGSAILAATGAPLIFDSFPPNERGKALGINSISWALGAISGPVLGGFLVAIDWRLIFYINVPVAAAAVVLGIRRIPQSLPNRNGVQAKGIGINFVSSIFVALSVASFLLWLTLFNILYALIGLVCLLILVFNEKRSSVPLLNVELRRNKGFLFTVISLGVIQTAFLGISFGLSLYYQSIIGLTPIMTGLAIVPLSILVGIVNPLSGRLVDRMKSPASLSIAGQLIVGVFSLLLGLDIGGSMSSPLYTALLLSVIGGGGGLVWTPIIVSTMRFARPELRGVANGTAFMFSNIGFAASIAIVVAVSAISLPSNLISEIYLGSLSNLTSVQALLFKEGISRAFLVLGIIDFVAIPLLVMTWREQRRTG